MLCSVGLCGTDLQLERRPQERERARALDPGRRRLDAAQRRCDPEVFQRLDARHPGINLGDLGMILLGGVLHRALHLDWDCALREGAAFAVRSGIVADDHLRVRDSLHNFNGAGGKSRNSWRGEISRTSLCLPSAPQFGPYGWDRADNTFL